MDVAQLLILAALGVLGGMFSGLVDGGGGIIFVPALVYAAGWDIKEAVAASLVVVVFASLSGTLRNLKWVPCSALGPKYASGRSRRRQ